MGWDRKICPMDKPGNGYTKYHSIRAKSFFFQFNAPLSSILKVSYKCFFCQTQVQIGSEVRLNKKVIMKIIDRLRKLCANFVAQNPVRLGGDGRWYSRANRPKYL